MLLNFRVIMKRFVCSLLAFCFVLASSISSLAQDLVFSGTVVGVSPESGTMILANGPDARLTFSGLQQARIRRVDGTVVSLAGLKPGMHVSVAYAGQGKQWILSKVLIPSEAEPESAPIITDRRYRTLFDGDITTNPGSKAAVDGDITTKAPNTANTDGDITTHADR